MRTSFKWDSGEVSGVWHRPAGGPPRRGLVLGHGASYNMNARFLVDVADALAARGIAVVRFNFPYAEAGRRVPDPQPRLEACFRAVASVVSEEIPRLFLGGKSMGGRIASHIAADGFPTRGLVFFGYPLHPPGKPDRPSRCPSEANQRADAVLAGDAGQLRHPRVTSPDGHIP